MECRDPNLRSKSWSIFNENLLALE